jgi:hypothetical protein
MALVIKDRVKETTTTTGTGTFNLAGAVSGFEGFIQVGDGNTTYYVCTDNTDFEIGIGTFTDASPDTLSRDTILQSSNSDNKVDWSAGTRTIFCTYPADKAVFEDASNNINGTFVGNITGNVTGNTSGTAATVTTAAQTNITSLGTLTALTVDDVAIDGKVVTLTGSTSDTATLTAGTNGTLDIVTTDAGGASANIQITADGTAELAGTTVTLDSSGGITLDADGGTITFADAGSSLGTITSSGYTGNVVGNVTGNVSGTAATVTGAAQTNITSLGTLTGLTVDGDVTLTGANYNVLWDKSDNALEFADNAKATFGADGDLEIYHDSSHSYIADVGTGGLRLKTGNAGVILFQNAENDTLASFTGNGANAFFHSNSKKLETTSAGVTVTGTLTATTLTGTLSTASQTNITSIGTLASNLNLGGQDIVTTTSNQDIDLQTHGTGKVVIKGNNDDSGSNVGAIKFNCEVNSHGQILKAAPHSASADNVLILPQGQNDSSAQELVAVDITQTLTNKTLTSPVLNTGVSGTAIKDEDDMTSDSATHLATQQSIKAYVDAQKADMQFVLEDGDGTEVQITKDKEVKFVEGGGLDINWTDTSTGSDGDPYDLTFTVNAAQTGIESLTNASLVIGRDADNDIDFSTDNQITFRTNGEDQIRITDGAIRPITDDNVDLGSSTKQFKDGFFDGTLEADAITVGGIALAEIISDTTGAMFSSNTETGITVTYQDADNTIDVVIDAAQTTITSLLATDIKIGEDDQTKIDFETANTINFYAGNEKQLILTDGALTPGADNILDLGSSSVEFKDAFFDGTVTSDAFAGPLTGDVTGNADTATALATGRTIGMTGDVVWTSASFDGSGNVTGSATIQAGAVENSMLADDAVGADELAANAVVNASVASGAAIAFSKMADLTASRALVSDGSGDVSVSAVTSTEIGYLDGVTSAIQTQLDAKTTATAAANEATALAIALG